MPDKVVHRLRVEHDWSAPELAEFGTSGDSSVSIKTCKVCYVQQRTLLVKGSSSSPTLDDLLERPNDHRNELEELTSSVFSMAENLQNYIRTVFKGSEHLSLADFAGHLDDAYENSVRHDDINLGLAKDFLKHTSKKVRRKLLLIRKQGPVCNRCDKIFPPDQLTIDHIFPRKSGGQTKLTNLQLLCKTCNSLKGDENPSCGDVSPFRYYGEPCSHSITCYDLSKLETTSD